MAANYLTNMTNVNRALVDEHVTERWLFQDAETVDSEPQLPSGHGHAPALPPSSPTGAPESMMSDAVMVSWITWSITKSEWLAGFQYGSLCKGLSIPITLYLSVSLRLM